MRAGAQAEATLAAQRKEATAAEATQAEATAEAAPVAVILEAQAEAIAAAATLVEAVQAATEVVAGLAAPAAIVEAAQGVIPTAATLGTRSQGRRTASQNGAQARSCSLNGLPSRALAKALGSQAFQIVFLSKVQLAGHYEHKRRLA